MNKRIVIMNGKMLVLLIVLIVSGVVAVCGCTSDSVKLTNKTFSNDRVEFNYPGSWNIVDLGDDYYNITGSGIKKGHFVINPPSKALTCKELYGDDLGMSHMIKNGYDYYYEEVPYKVMHHTECGIKGIFVKKEVSYEIMIDGLPDPKDGFATIVRSFKIK